MADSGSSDVLQWNAGLELQHTSEARRPKLVAADESVVSFFKGSNAKQPLAARHQTGFRASLHRLLDVPRSSSSARVVFFLIVFTVFVSVVVFYLRAVPGLAPPNSGMDTALRNLEIFCAVVFTLELLLRCVVATLDVRRLCLYDVYFYIDLVSILPSYTEFTLIIIGSEIGSTAMSNALDWLQLLRLLRILKLLRHYSGWRVLLFALHESWQALLVPVFAMFMCILLLSGALWLLEGARPESDAKFDDGFDALWCVFWIIFTLGYDGPMGSGGGVGQVVLGMAILVGLILTTMPITIIGEAFR